MRLAPSDLTLTLLRSLPVRTLSTVPNAARWRWHGSWAPTLPLWLLDEPLNSLNGRLVRRQRCAWCWKHILDECFPLGSPPPPTRRLHDLGRLALWISVMSGFAALIGARPAIGVVFSGASRSGSPSSSCATACSQLGIGARGSVLARHRCGRSVVRRVVRRAGASSRLDRLFAAAAVHEDVTARSSVSGALPL